MINCTELLNSHSGYFSYPKIYECMKKRKNWRASDLEIIQDGQFLTGGTLSITRLRKPKMEDVS